MTFYFFIYHYFNKAVVRLAPILIIKIIAKNQRFVEQASQKDNLKAAVRPSLITKGGGFPKSLLDLMR